MSESKFISIKEVYRFIDESLKNYCENSSYIKDCVGFGAKQL